ncbi:STN domain-containing protein [Herbaspirillum chlorophenolicum]|uniref:STN domain-containing protein n=1 Tax=Herbaspirillum chlorophenolicum TaxID=211589 RepID=A0ABW8F5F5_9BURK
MGLFILACCLLLGGAVFSAEKNADESGVAMYFDIPPQPLGMALQRYANETGKSVFFDNALTDGKSSMAVQGMLTSEQALSRLLDGSGLVARYTSATAFTVIAATAEADQSVIVPALEDGGNKQKQFLDSQYARRIQAALERELCKSQQTRPGTYRALIRFWLDGKGHVQRGGLLGSTGVIARDKAINQVLRMLEIPQPASGTAMTDEPFTILLLPQSDNTVDVCLAAAEREF